MTLQVNTHLGSYPITIERGAIRRAGELLNLTGRRVCIVTDTGVPEPYVQAIAAGCENPLIFCFAQGEQNKSFDTLRSLLAQLLHHGFDRTDAIVAVGGGVVTDLAGFAAATYMRGIDFYNVPTTLLCAVDASVGGKTAIDFDGYKNMIGAFWQPRAVLIDPETLDTLPRRRIADGLAEVVKMALTNDAALFETIEQTVLLPGEGEPLPEAIDDIIARALAIKIFVVENDVREKGLRRVLNFGHTLGHAIESCVGLGELYHGECVALGMVPMCSDAVRARLLPVLVRCGLPTATKHLPSKHELLRALKHDKKAAGAHIHAVIVDSVGSFRMENITAEALADALYACPFGKE
ncbi:MAG: 3-dehydroquinate synthase [Clostridia bacterium]|nr:3-dehydroquinate synthase [Clostridia bacterium]